MFKMGSFRSYVGLDEYEMRVPQPVTSTFLQPHFLPGELVVAAANNVLKFTSQTKSQGISGELFVTNARLVFVSSTPASPGASTSSRDSEDSIPLLSVHTLCYYEGSNHSTGKKTKRKVYLGSHSRLSDGNTSSITNSTSSTTSSSPLNTSGSSLGNSNSHLFCSASTRVHELYVICSNFRTLRVDFKFSPVDHGQKICNALMHWSFPQQVEKLFYLDYCRALDKKQNITQNNASSFNDSFYSPRSTTIASGFIASWVPSYSVPGDWLRELKITRSPGFRLTDANANYELCQSLPEHFVVPAGLTDVRLISLAGKLRGNRPPFWAWGDASGATIIRMAKLYNEADSSAENAFYEMLRKASPQRKQPRIYDLDNAVTIKDLKQSLTKLSEFCCPESYSHHEEDDSKFFSQIESTKWMLWVSRIMHLAREIADVMVSSNGIVILQENESRDTSCLLSSIIQVLIDPRFRTITGFFSLIQKEWVMTGHQFHSVYMHTSPVFLLFLDITHQLMIQNPFEFEFNEEFLSDLWDSTFDSTTGTFMFDSPNQRKDLESRKDLTAWFRILTKEEMHDDESKSTLSSSSIPVIPKCLCNPMFKLKALLHPPSIDKFTFSPTAVTLPMIQTAWEMSHLEFWSSLYLNRTVENNSSLPSMTFCSPSLLPFAKSYGAAVPQTPTPSSSSHNPAPSSIFLFSSTINNNVEIPGSVSTSSIIGRDLMYEMKLVETLLNKLSVSTSFRRNNHVRTTPAISSSSLPMQTGRGIISQKANQQGSPKPLITQRSAASVVQTQFVPGYARPGIERPLPKPRTSRPPIIAHNELSGSVARRKNPFSSSLQEQDCE